MKCKARGRNPDVVVYTSRHSKIELLNYLALIVSSIFIKNTYVSTVTTFKPVCRYLHTVMVSNGLDDGRPTPMEVVYQVRTVSFTDLYPTDQAAGSVDSQ